MCARFTPTFPAASTLHLQQKRFLVGLVDLVAPLPESPSDLTDIVRLFGHSRGSSQMSCKGRVNEGMKRGGAKRVARQTIRDTTADCEVHIVSATPETQAESTIRGGTYYAFTRVSYEWVAHEYVITHLRALSHSTPCIRRWSKMASCPGTGR